MADSMKIKALQEERLGIVTKMVAIRDGAAKENRPMTVEENAQFDAMEKDESGLVSQLETAERSEKADKLSASLSFSKDKANFIANPKTVSNSHLTYQEEVDVLKYFLAKNSTPANGDEGDRFSRNLSRWEAAAQKKHYRDSNRISLKVDASHYTSFASSSPMSHVGSAGGDILPVILAKQIDVALKLISGMRRACKIMRTADGNTFNYPTSDDTSSVGVRLAGSGDNQPRANVSDPTFNLKVFNAYTYSSNACLVPMELLQDVGFDLVGFISENLAQRIGRIHNTEFTTLSSTAGGPVGILSASGGASAATVSSTGGPNTASKVNIAYGELQNLQHSVDPYYREKESTGYMFSDNTLKVLKTMVDTQNRPLWLPATYGVPTVAGTGADTIANFKYTINTSMPDFGTPSNKCLLFGDFGEYIIRDVLDFQVQRLNELYAANGQVGFLGFSRNDAKFVGPSYSMAYATCGSST